MNKEAFTVINTPFIKLDAFLKYSGITGSGGEAKVLIKDEKVAVNGIICTKRGKKLVNGDNVEVKSIGFKRTVKASKENDEGKEKA